MGDPGFKPGVPNRSASWSSHSGATASGCSDVVPYLLHDYRRFRPKGSGAGSGALPGYESDFSRD
jgi:hypothetical protein